MMFSAYYIAYQHITVNQLYHEHALAKGAMQELSILFNVLSISATLTLVSDENCSRNLFISSSDLNQLKEKKISINCMYCRGAIVFFLFFFTSFSSFHSPLDVAKKERKRNSARKQCRNLIARLLFICIKTRYNTDNVSILCARSFSN